MGSAPEERAWPSNALLSELRNREFGDWRPRIEERNVHSGEVLLHPGEMNPQVWFPCGRTLLSMIVALEDGREVHALSIGREGAVGGLTGAALRTYARIVVKNPGTVIRIPVEAIEEAKQRSAAFKSRFARYVDCLFAQTVQSLACNAVHSIESRAATWILRSLDRTEGDTVALTQEELAAMLGVGRSYANRITQSLKAQGLLTTRRAMIVVPRRAALEAKACKCASWVKDHCEGSDPAGFSAFP
jgi:CRP-like cAMP-binding protein